MASKKNNKDKIEAISDDLTASPALPVTVYPPEDSGVHTYASPTIADPTPVEDSTPRKKRPSSGRSKTTSK